MKTQDKAPSIYEIKNTLVDGIRRISANPTIYGYRPQNHQEAFHKSLKKGRVLLGGNRAGKTVAGGSEMVMRLTGTHPWNQKFKPPLKGRAIGVDIDNGINRIIKPEIARWMPPSMLINGSWEDSYSKGDRQLTLANGSTLEFMSYEQEVQKFAGTSRHVVWFDEEPPEEIFTENMARLVDVEGDWWLTMTPLIDMSWTYDRLYLPAVAGQNLNLDIFQASVFDNVFINPAEVAILTEDLSDEEAMARTDGKYYTYAGTIYSKAIDPKINYIDSIIDGPYWGTYLQKWGHFAMLDHGYTNPTAFLLACYDESGRIVVYDEIYQSKKLVKENAEDIKEKMLSLSVNEQMTYIVADPSTKNTDPISGGSISMEYADHGVYLSMGDNEVRAGISRVMSRFKNKQLFITRNCEKLIWELERYRWAKYDTSKARVKNNQKEVPLKKEDHACDALRYGVMSRPELDQDQNFPVGNILSLPQAVSDIFIDEEVLPNYEENHSNFDDNLGDDW